MMMMTVMATDKIMMVTYMMMMSDGNIYDDDSEATDKIVMATYMMTMMTCTHALYLQLLDNQRWKYQTRTITKPHSCSKKYCLEVFSMTWSP